ncbi:MAG: glycosyltransferase family 39 protein [Steroidobacteraceae bacterium]
MNHANTVTRRQLVWLGVAALLLIASGFGLRDPWPADEPRFALIARDMVLTGQWLFPRVGGELYADKPPMYFWLLAACYSVLGSIRWSFLIPSIVAAFGTLALTYDLARRVWNEHAAFLTTATLLCTLQFVATFRGAQIDPTLCFLVTLGAYGILRHLLLGPAWQWYVLGGVAAGLGIITKGVGFLPLFLMLPYVLLRALKFAGLPRFAGGWRWLLLLPGLLLGVAPWIVPMLLAVLTSNSADLRAYMNEILYDQTVNRYASAWHHHKPWHYFLTQVIPGLWLPWSLLLFWLVPGWLRAWRSRDARQWLPLLWVLVVLVFFSLSPGKRGVYLLAALPVFAFAGAGHLTRLYALHGVQRLSLGLASTVTLVALLGAVALHWNIRGLGTSAHMGGLESFWPVYFIAAGAVVALVLTWRSAPLLAWPAVLLIVVLGWAYGGMPQMNEQRSGRLFVRSILAAQPEGRTLALVGYKEQFLLYLQRPLLNFGHRRAREGLQEEYDAAAWLNAAPDRVLLVAADNMKACFGASPRQQTGRGRSERWYFVTAPAKTECAAAGNPERPILYPPPGAHFVPE